MEVGKFRRFVYFCVNIDHDEIGKLKSYDNSLIYASFIRQSLSMLFVFGVFLFAWSVLIPFWMALVLSSLLALIIFFIDQAIIASEWMFHKNVSRFWIINAPVNFVLKIIQLFPRILYALVIAAVISTLAEITIQANAIQRELNKETNLANEEFFDRRDTLVDRQNTEIETITDEIKRLKVLIKASSNASTTLTIETINTDVEFSRTQVADLRSSLSRLRTTIAGIEAEIITLKGETQALRANVTEQEKLMKREITPNTTRCRSNKPTDCDGPRYNRFKVQRDAFASSLIIKNDAIATKEELLQTTKVSLNSALSKLQAAEEALTGSISELGKIQTTEKTLTELQSELSRQKKLLADANSRHSGELENEVALLEISGKFTEADYDALDLYVGLLKIHNPPAIPLTGDEKEDEQIRIRTEEANLRAEAAKEFSKGLWLFIILVELSPVFIAVFAAPFSFYAIRMRKKRDVALARDLKKRVKRNKKIRLHYASDKISDAKTLSNTKSCLSSIKRDAANKEARKKIKAKLIISKHQRKAKKKSEAQNRKDQKLERKAQKEFARKNDTEAQDLVRESEILSQKIKNQQKLNELLNKEFDTLMAEEHNNDIRTSDDDIGSILRGEQNGKP